MLVVQTQELGTSWYTIIRELNQGRTFGQILGGGEAFCSDKITSHVPNVLEQKTIVLLNTVRIRKGFFLLCSA